MFGPVQFFKKQKDKINENFIVRDSNKYSLSFHSQKQGASANSLQLFCRVDKKADDKRENSWKTVYQFYDDIDILQCSAIQMTFQNSAGDMAYAYIHENFPQDSVTDSRISISCRYFNSYLYVFHVKIHISDQNLFF